MYKFLIATIGCVLLMALNLHPAITMASKILFFICLVPFSYQFIKELIPQKSEPWKA